MQKTYIPSTPYARLIAEEKGIDIGQATPTGPYGEVKAKDILKVAQAGSGRITPLARRIAEASGVELCTVTGSGFKGKIVKKDVLKARDMKMSGPKDMSKSESGQASSGESPEKRVRLSGMRKVVAQRMSQSHTQIPSVTQNVKVDVTVLLQARKKINEKAEIKISVNDFVLMATARALSTHRNMLVSLEGEEIVYKSDINLGMAVALDAGLIVPVIRNADTMSLYELSAAAKDLAKRARSNKLIPDEYKGNTFSISNLGMFDVESFTPIINQPDAAILGICAIQDELVMEHGAVCVHKVMRTSLTYDHRLLDGATAAKFQKELKRLLENPIEIVM